MSREQANVFRKHREADDRGGNLAWASRVGARALRVAAESGRFDVEAVFELDDLEKIVWRLLKLPRRYTELEHAGLFDADELRAVLRGFVAADVVDVVDASEAKALLPAEIKRLKAEVKGKEWRPKVGGLSAKVYRPDIFSGEGAPVSAEGAAVSSAMSSEGAPIPSSPTPAPAPVTLPQIKLSPDEQKLKDTLVQAAQAMAKMSHYQFFGVSQKADDTVIRTAYVHLAREYHPDKISGTSLTGDPEARDAIEKLFKRLGEANKAIATAEARARYDRELALNESSSTVPVASGDAKKPRRSVEARSAYTMAETFFKKADYRQAEIHYRQAVMFDGEEPMLQVALAWCIFLNPDHPKDNRVADAKKRLEELAKKTRNGEAYYKYGRVLRESGEEAAALAAFQRCLDKTPGHIEAQREVRLAQSRKEKADKQKEEEQAGLLGRFTKAFKK